MSDEEVRAEDSAGPQIARRDFIRGVAVTAGGLLVGGATGVRGAFGASTALTAAEYPPLRAGLRGQHEGSFEVAHMARDGAFAGPLEAEETGEHYDLVIVGGGISGLSAAYFYRKALGEGLKVLIIENHDDFGGHAKRNEFRHGGRTFLSYGGTMSISTPFPYGFIADSMLDELGIDPKSYGKYEREEEVYAGLTQGMFFDKDNFLADKVVPGYGTRPWEAFFADAPLKDDVRADLVRLHKGGVDYLPGLGPEEKAVALRKMSFQDFLLTHAGMKPESLPFFKGMAFRNNMRVDTCPAYIAAQRSPIFSGMAVAEAPRRSSDFFRFPDGNASIARLLVSRLTPDVFDGPVDAETVVSAGLDYAALDRGGGDVRIRLNSIVVRVEHIGDPSPVTEEAVRTVYVKDGRRLSVTSANVILACFNSIIPMIAPDLPAEQAEALKYPSKVPMQYTSVLVRNWHAWKDLGLKSIVAPNGYHTSASLDVPMTIGRYRSAFTPDEPVVVSMVRNPNSPGLPRKEQNRFGRMDMLTTPFATVEARVRDQLQRMLGSGGFKESEDILAITVNRWPHGYAYTYDTLGDPDAPEAERPHVIGRKPFGRIAIANADSAAAAFTNSAIEQAHRAVQEVLISRGLT